MCCTMGHIHSGESHKLLLKLKEPYYPTMIQGIKIFSATHCLCVCGDAGINTTLRCQLEMGS